MADDAVAGCPAEETCHGHVHRRSTHSRRAAKHADAIALLKADHAQVAAWFDEYRSAEQPHFKLGVARRICGALRIHSAIEEEMFYPAFLAATKDKERRHESAIEHAAAGKLIAEVEATDPRDDYCDSKL